MRDLHPILLDNVQYARALADGRKFVKLIATGKDIETAPDIYKREIVLVFFKEMPIYGDRPPFYFLPADDEEIKELATGDHNYVVYIERGSC